MGHIDTVQGSKMGPITTLNTDKWATSTLCRDQEQNGATHHSEQENWVTSAFYRDQEQNGAHRHSEHGKNGPRRHGVKTRNKMGPITTLKGKNGSHRHCAETGNKTGHIANEQRTATKSRNTSEHQT